MALAKEPHNVTGLLAKLEYCICLTCLKKLKLWSSNIFDNDNEALYDSLFPWFTEKTNSPFAHIRSLQHCASSIAFTMMGMPCIWWTNQICWKELLYNGDKIYIDQLHNMFAASEETIINLWEEKILKGISIHTCWLSGPFKFIRKSWSGLFFLDRSSQQLLSKLQHLGTYFHGQFQDQNNVSKVTFVMERSALMQWLQDYTEF